MKTRIVACPECGKTIIKTAARGVMEVRCPKCGTECTLEQRDDALILRECTLLDYYKASH